jgi:hypothetical protein
MERPDICSPLEEFIARLEQRQQAAQDRCRDLRKALDKALIDAEFGDTDPNQVDRCRRELERAVREEANAAEAIRWSWRLHLFVNGTRASVAPPKVLNAVEALDAPPAQALVGKPNSKTSRVCATIESALRQHGPLHRQRLLEILVADGVMGTETRPINRLASILTENRHLFSSDGRGTYFLAATGHMEQRQVSELTGLSGQGQHSCPAPPLQPGGECNASTCSL